MTDRSELESPGSSAETELRRQADAPSGSQPDVQAEIQAEVQPRWMRVSLIVVGLAVLLLVVVLSRV